MSGHLRAKLTAYRHERDGSITAFSLFIFLCMLLFGGVAVDLMMYENDRTHLVNSTDRAVLAAANLDQTVDPTTVVIDYLAKVGIPATAEDVTVTETNVGTAITGRQVSVDIDMLYETLLMDLVGVPNLPYASNSEATEAINDIEISLILDVSGSMGNPSSKLANMQTAAKDFVTKILESTSDDSVSISLIPYSTQVSAGSQLLSLMNVSDRHSHSNCLDFASSDFSSTAIDHSSAISQSGHFDPWRSRSYGQTPRWFVCRNESYFDITPWSNSVTALHNQIDAFEAEGNTSIDVAVKWGAALLDPSMQPQLTALAGTGDVNAAFAGRPFLHDREDTLKFIVVMTDGINTTQYYLDGAYKSGQSPIYVDTATGRLSSDDEEYRDRDGDNDWWEDYWYVNGRYWIDDPYDSDGSGSGSQAVRLDWSDVWSVMSVKWWAYYLHYTQYWRASDYYSAFDDAVREVSAAAKDARMSSICQAAKDQGIIVFAVGFEVTDASADVMEDCASTPSHFYRVNGLDIQVAFASIANQINQLKLTQ